MDKKIKFILGVCCLLVVCLGLTACASTTELQEYQGKGYDISVTYNANGGKFLGRDGVSIMDLFKPADYPQDAEGKVHIKLLEPTDSRRPASGTGAIVVTKPNYFFAGWYQNRTLVTNAEGQPLDAYGRELEESGGHYFYAGTKVSAEPAYTYSGYWDFANDTVDYSIGDGKLSMTLYAGWVPYYEFNYYHKQDGEWVLFGTTAFDYKSVNAKDSTLDSDIIWLPAWKDGAMNHAYTYSNNTPYNFPKVMGATFSSAYLDEQCQHEINGLYKHPGTLDLEKGLAIDRVQNIYVVFEEGERFKIETAQQLSKHAKPAGIYEILADLDFTDITWPTAFSLGTFIGEIYSAQGQNYTLKNIKLNHASSSATAGGLFARITKDANIQNLTFENITFNIADVGARLRDTNFGLFAGIIEDGAKLSQVTVDGGMLRIGPIVPGDNYSINLLANGDVSGIIVQQPIRLQVYGTNLGIYHEFVFDPKNITIEEDGNIILQFGRHQFNTNEYGSGELVFDEHGEVVT